MRASGKFFLDVSSLMTNAAGVMQGAKTEAENALNARLDRWLADRDFVTREEFDALQTMAQKTADELEALKLEISASKKKRGG